MSAALRELLRKSGRAVPLAEAGLLIAKAERPALDVAAYLAKLDEMGAMARRLIAAGTGGPAKHDLGGTPLPISLLGSYLFRDVGLRGNRTNYYDPANSYLDQVIDRRLGIPITLSIVYVEVGRRAGLSPEPVAFPGHFLVKHDTPGGPIVVDPFEAGRVLGPDDCKRLLESRFGHEMPFAPQLLRAAEPREVLARVLRNLKTIYGRAGDHERTFRIVDEILLFEPAARDDLRDRGVLAAQLGKLDRAITDLVRYTNQIPDTPERRALRLRIDTLRIRRGLLN